MRFSSRYLFSLGLLAVGYVVGSAGFGQPDHLAAQEEEASLSDSAFEAVRTAQVAAFAAMRVLRDEDKYSAVTTEMNGFSVSVGGVDAVRDLESGRGVDPETYAALYAGLAIDTVRDQLGHNDSGHLTYKNRVVRMYSVERLKKMFAQRALIAGKQADGSADDF